jgi:hypothetical protein
MMKPISVEELAAERREIVKAEKLIAGQKLIIEC